MQSFSLSDLKHRSNELSQEAEKGNLTLITQYGQPLLLGVPFDDRLLQCGIYMILAENLYKEKMLSLGKAAKLAGLSIAEFAEHLSQLGIPVVDYAVKEIDEELEYFL